MCKGGIQGFGEILRFNAFVAWVVKPNGIEPRDKLSNRFSFRQSFGVTELSSRLQVC